MILSEYYSHYFNNGGICPCCNHLMTMHFGCTNVACKDCVKHMSEDELFKKRAWGYQRKRDKEKKKYNQFLRKLNARRKKNLDKRQDKKYADVKHS